MPHHRLIILSLAISLAVLASQLGSDGVLPTASADSTGLRLYAHSNGWDYARPQFLTNPVLEVNWGDTVSITLVSDDQAAHLFLLDVDNNGPSLDCPGLDMCAEVFGQGQTVTLTFTANFTAGVYRYYDYFYPQTAHGTFIVQAPDFAIWAGSETFAFANGSSTSTSIQVTSYGKFNGTLNLSAAVSPSGLSASLAISVLALKEEQFNFTILTLSGSVPGTFIVTLTATNGTVSRYSGAITVIVTDGPDFVLTSSPSSQWAYAGIGSSTGIRVTSTGFEGTVLLSTAVSPSGPSATLSLASTLV